MTKHIPFHVPSFASFFGLALLSGATAALAQSPAPVAPSDIDRTHLRASARALGMGGTDLIVLGDISGAAYNPAAIANAGAYSEAQTISGRTSNVNVSKINDLSKGLRDLGNQTSSGSSTLAPVRDAFQKVYRFATDAGASDTSSTPATLDASVAPLVGASVKNVGIVGYGMLAAQVQLQPVAIPVSGLNGQTGQVYARYGVLGLTNIGIPIGITTPVGAVGIMPRYVEASYAGAGFLADETVENGTRVDPNVPNGLIVGATYREVHQSKFDVDLGFTSIPDPLYHIQGAIVVHNLLSPTFHLPRVVNSHVGVIPTGGDFDFQMKPQVDVGAASRYNGVTYAAELHNLNSVNGGKSTVHLGVEYPIGGTFSLRGGYDANRFVAGLGFSFGGVRLDLATGTNPQEQVALGLTFSGK